MTDIAVRVENLGKRYRIGSREPSQPMLREVLTDLLLSPARNLRALTRHVRRGTSAEGAVSHVWALRGVSFDVERGEVLGIIGPNGAGKSTLLKILSRITEPTEGRAEIRGRIAALLEVGTGFHPELTGRENIYLSGALLGMRKADIDRNLDEIIDFSGVEKFIDTPVKHYSSGMYVRLAFAVAAHLEPDILIVDEVLAVGDVAFQRKCLAKMEDVRQHGRTVLFVSHNMPAVMRLCQRAILISDGSVQKDGSTAQIVSAYLFSGLGITPQRLWSDLTAAPGNRIARLRGFRVRTEDGLTAESIDAAQPVGLEMAYEVLESGHVLVPYYEFFNQDGVCVFIAHDASPEWSGRPRPTGQFTSTAWIPGNFLSEGTLLVGAALVTVNPMKVHFHERNLVAFQVVRDAEGTPGGGDWPPLAGVVRPLLEWTTEFTPNF